MRSNGPESSAVTRGAARSVARGLVVAAVLTTASFASAQNVSAVAEKHFAAGVKAYDQKDFAAALDEFRQSYKLSPAPSVLRNIGQCELKTGKPLEALGAFRAYVSDPAIPKRKRQLAEASVAEAYQQTGHLNVLHESDAHVRIDGADAELVEGAYDVTVGTHTVQVTAGDRAGSKQVDALAGRVVLVEVTLGKAAPVAPVVAPVNETPPVTVATSPSAGTDAASTTNPASGSSAAKWVTVGSLGAVGVAGLVLGGVFTAKASSARDAVTSLPAGTRCPSGAGCAAARDGFSSYGSDHDVAVGSFIVGGAAFVAGVVLLVVWPRSAPAAEAFSPTSPLSFTF